MLFLAPSTQLSGQTLRFVADSNYPPVTWWRDGAAAGVYVDIARAVALELKQPFSIEVEEWAKAQNEVAEGAADVLYSVSYSKERAQRFDLTLPVTRNEFAFFNLAGRRGLDTLEDLDGLRVGVTEGGLPRRLIERLPRVVTVPFPTYQTGFDALTAGDIDTFAGDLWVGAYTLVQEKRKGIGPSRHVFASLAAGFAVKKGNQELLERLNGAIARLKNNGTIDAILNRWHPETVVIQTKGQVSAGILITTASVLGAVLVVMAAWVFLLRREIRQRRLAEKAKETLLRELHHRTRNNMGVITALLELHAAGDPELAAALLLTQNQIFAMSLVHEHLYKTGELSRVPMRSYIEELSNHIGSSYGLDPDRMTITFDVEDLAVLIDTAVPLGLILNELIGNAIRHAFPAPRQGEIMVSLKRAEAGIEAAVKDTGKGFEHGFDPRQNGGLGLQTVLKLAEEQLKARVTLYSDHGVEVRMVFQDSLYQERIER